MHDTSNSTPAGSLTRPRVADMLGVSIAGVRRREGKTLHPQRGPNGQCLFDPAQVEAERKRMLAEGQFTPTAPQLAPALAVQAEPTTLAGTVGVLAEAPEEPGPAAFEEEGPAPTKPEADGSTAAKLFALFGQGKSPVEVVIETQVAAARVEQFYETWLRLQAIDTTSVAARSRIEAVAADVKRIESRVEDLSAFAGALSEATNVHDQDASAFVGELSGLAECVRAIQQQLADPTIRETAEFASDAAGQMIVRVASIERTIQTWTPAIQAIFQRLRT